MNRLKHATSPYLLQHANNPVDWYEWGEQALQLARNENRPIFLSIGYAACHWCHVMAHESFEDAETAALMNANFVNIKVDREQRPDLDSIYMAATVAMTGSGGWPMSVFLTPDLQPFYAGTYFPSQARFNLPSFRDLLTSIARAWREEHEHVVEISGQVTAHLKQQSSALTGQAVWSENQLDAAARRLYDDYDWGFGGWGGAPKFPQPMTIEFLLRRSLARSGSSTMAGSGKPEESQPDFLKPVLHALRAMARGGMYDVVGGGFSRYSTDIEWRVPHFEKMLYDNAQLALVYLHAWQVTGEPFFRRVVEQTLNFVLRELQDPQGGFYSSLDADSEGEEGKFYLWSYNELKDALAEELDFFRSAYFVSPQGNWEGRIILQRALDDATLASRFGITPETVVTRLAACHSRLLAVRSLRPRPGTDDKVLAAWNGLMLSALAQAARSLPANPAQGSNFQANNLFLDAATRNADFLLSALMPEGSLHRSWRAEVSSPEVFLDDFAALILGLLDLYETDFNNRWFISALRLADEMIQRFDDPDGGFFDTPVDGESLLIRPKDLQDNAIPSANALACEALLRLAAFTDRVDFRQKAEQMLGIIAEPALRFPTAFGRWLQAADFGLASVKQIAILGQDGGPAWQELLSEVRSTYRPRTVVSASTLPVSEDAPFVLQGRDLLGGQPTAYVCEGFFCKLPVVNPQALRELLESGDR